MKNNKVINIHEYIEEKRVAKAGKKLSYKKKSKHVEEEEREKTLNLFMRVLATIQKESYR